MCDILCDILKGAPPLKAVIYNMGPFTLTITLILLTWIFNLVSLLGNNTVQKYIIYLEKASVVLILLRSCFTTIAATLVELSMCEKELELLHYYYFVVILHVILPKFNPHH